MNELFLAIITALLAIIGYFIKRIFDRLDIIGEDVSDMKPKVNVLWSDTRPKVDMLWAEWVGVKQKVDALWSDTKPRIDLLWSDKYAPARSPRQLNERGTAIFIESGIKEIIDQKKDELLAAVKKKHPTNPYDADILVWKVMSTLPSRYPDIVERLKDGAFKTGVDINTVLFVGSIYLRDQIFPDLGFSVG